MWDMFFRELGVKVVVSPDTNNEIMQQGVMNTIDEACLPLKVYLGHVIKLTKEKVDFIFIPRFISVEKHRYLCPKFLGLPDLIRNTTQTFNLPEILDPTINMRITKKEFYLEVLKLASRLNKNPVRIYNAVSKAFKANENYKQLVLAGYSYTEALKIYQKQSATFADTNFLENSQQQATNKPFKIAVISHSYILHDPHMSMNLLNKLDEMGCEIKTPEMLEGDVIDKSLENLQKDMFWSLNREIMGASFYHLAKKDIDGMIILNAFACGPDAITKELIERLCKRESEIPMLSLTIDEHTGEAGFVTRLEAFIDMIKRKDKGGYKDESNLSTHGELLCRDKSVV
ncbi:hypothetical protein BHF68_02090 [Desulfuribacillus alkaliarsenatis]|uniref:DUF2229 domain-containing protein n=2 Tax=Desulfuribacillus alkaliarsenatis TaxID=766136 RepID=A0A1E5G6E2_9FIRM|nr:hypothetical protein BHF68_02090 [Desulfuribacillus alkaliarsenatis]